MNRRDFLWLLGGAAIGVGSYRGGLWLSDRGTASPPQSLHVNDVHSKLNATVLKAIERPASLDELVGIVRRAKRTGDPVCIAGSRHAMGGQQFAKGAVLVDTRGLDTVMDLDSKTGVVQVGAGIEWPELVSNLASRQQGVADYWTIRSKQTGADRLTLGGAISANAHGRTLRQPPMVSDIEELLIVDGDGDIVRCDRKSNHELFSLAVGGYGLFGVIHSATYRLERRHKLRRNVEIVDADDLLDKFNEKLRQGYTLGDWQYAIDDRSDQFLHTGVFSCYKPVPMDTPIREGQESVSDRAWQELVYLAHADKSEAFRLYSEYYLRTSGQIYWSDTSQLGTYDLDYHEDTDRRLKSANPATEMITELYVPRVKLAAFLRSAAESLRRARANVIYGTVRLVEEDTETFLRWAREPYACIIFNLHVTHTDVEIRRAAESFQMLIDLAVGFGGTYYLTYHRWARKEQVLACYPQFAEFLQHKSRLDPGGRFQSEWYRHYKQMFAA